MRETEKAIQDFEGAELAFHLHKALRHLIAEARKVDDYAMLLRMLAHHLREDRDWSARITGLLAKHGGLGSPLRSAPDAETKEVSHG